MGFVQRLKTELFSVAMKHTYIDIYIYTIGVCERDQRERDQRERREREDRNEECLLEDRFRLQFDWREQIEKDTNNKQPRTCIPTTSHTPGSFVPALSISLESNSVHIVIVQELCESQDGRPGLYVLTSLLVSVDVKIY